MGWLVVCSFCLFGEKRVTCRIWADGRRKDGGGGWLFFLLLIVFEVVRASYVVIVVVAAALARMVFCSL